MPFLPTASSGASWHDFVTSRQVVLGSDYPFPIGDFDPVRSVREAQLGSEATQAILGENAQTLFRLR